MLRLAATDDASERARSPFRSTSPPGGAPKLDKLNGPQIATARELHAINSENFRTCCNLIERTIIQQINTAVNQDCLTDLIDDDTGLLEGTVLQIMKELFDS